MRELCSAPVHEQPGLWPGGRSVTGESRALAPSRQEGARDLNAPALARSEGDSGIAEPFGQQLFRGHQIQCPFGDLKASGMLAGRERGVCACMYARSVCVHTSLPMCTHLLPSIHFPLV